MNSFLDRQTINNTQIDNLVYSKPMYYPQKKDFADFVSTILDVTLSYDKSMDNWFLKIQPSFDKNIVMERMKQYAFNYSEHVRNRKRSIEKFKKGNCPQPSMELPQIPIYGELGGRII
jgi:hypothetical protein